MKRNWRARVAPGRPVVAGGRATVERTCARTHPVPGRKPNQLTHISKNGAPVAVVVVISVGVVCVLLGVFASRIPAKREAASRKDSSRRASSYTRAPPVCESDPSRPPPAAG